MENPFAEIAPAWREFGHLPGAAKDAPLGFSPFGLGKVQPLYLGAVRLGNQGTGLVPLQRTKVSCCRGNGFVGGPAEGVNALGGGQYPPVEALAN